MGMLQPACLHQLRAFGAYIEKSVTMRREEREDNAQTHATLQCRLVRELNALHVNLARRSGDISGGCVRGIGILELWSRRRVGR